MERTAFAPLGHGFVGPGPGGGGCGGRGGSGRGEQAGGVRGRGRCVRRAGMSHHLPAIDGHGPSLLFDHVDKSLGQLRIPPALLRELREVDEFKPHDFQLDGVDAVNEDGTHTETPETVKPSFEWRKYGAPGIGLQWRQVPFDDSVEVHDRKLDAETLAMQKRMTERAYQAYLNGGGGFMGDRTLERAFIVPDREKDRRTKKLQQSRAVHGELRERLDAAKVSPCRFPCGVRCRPACSLMRVLRRRPCKQGFGERCCGPCIRGST